VSYPRLLSNRSLQTPRIIYHSSCMFHLHSDRVGAALKESYHPIKNTLAIVWPFSLFRVRSRRARRAFSTSSKAPYHKHSLSGGPAMPSLHTPLPETKDSINYARTCAQFPPAPTETTKSTISSLGLIVHPEGGYFVETDRDPLLVPNPFVDSPAYENASSKHAPSTPSTAAAADTSSSTRTRSTP
jgi:Cupin superfamily (DUF985)